jgi:hypothetical protein
MTEGEWLSGSNVDELLTYLGPRADARRLRLLACACCRAIWPQLPDPRSRAGIEVAERYADGKASKRELAEALTQAVAAVGTGERNAGYAPYWTLKYNLRDCLANILSAAVGAATRSAVGPARTGKQSEVWTMATASAIASATATQAELVREVFGNPFRPAVLPAALRTPVVLGLARQAYAEHDFALLPVLADALEDAGCEDGQLIAHLHGPGPHVRGCWALDRILGRSE